MTSRLFQAQGLRISSYNDGLCHPGETAFVHKSSTVCPYAGTGTGTGLSTGSAAQAAGRLEEARANYEAAARHPTAYYGQLARASSGWATWYCMSPPNLVGANGPTSRCRCSPTGSRDSLAIRLAHRHTDPLPDCVEFGVADMERIMRAHGVGGAPPNSLFTGLPCSAILELGRRRQGERA